MSVKVVEVTKFGSLRQSRGQRHRINHRSNEFYFDPDDPFRSGFIFR